LGGSGELKGGKQNMYEAPHTHDDRKGKPLDSIFNYMGFILGESMEKVCQKKTC